MGVLNGAMRGPAKVAYVTGESLRQATAAGVRIAGIANALTHAGVQVTVYSAEAFGSCVASDLAELAGPGVTFEIVAPLDEGRFNRVTGWSRGNPHLSDAVSRGGFDAVLGYGTKSGLVNQILRSRVPNNRRALDVVEYYQPTHRLRSRWALHSLEHEYMMRVGALSLPRVVVISRLLQQHFRSRGIEALRVPPLMNPIICRPISQFRESDGLVHLCFAGSLGGKDRASVANLVQAVARLDPAGRLFRVHLVGPTSLDVESAIKPVRSDAPFLNVHGPLTYRAAVAVVSACDFTVVQRPQKRYAMAGFPSKVIESWTVGTPIIANLTSDLNEYMTPQFNGLVLEAPTLAAMATGLGRAIGDVDNFSRAAISSWANEVFSPAAMAGPLADFLL